MMHGQRADELLGAVTHLGLDIRPAAMDVTWSDVFDAVRGLKAFVEREGLAYGIANDFDVTDAFLNSARNRIEAAFAA